MERKVVIGIRSRLPLSLVCATVVLCAGVAGFAATFERPRYGSFLSSFGDRSEIAPEPAAAVALPAFTPPVLQLEAVVEASAVPTEAAVAAPVRQLRVSSSAVPVAVLAEPAAAPAGTPPPSATPEPRAPSAAAPQSVIEPPAQQALVADASGASADAAGPNANSGQTGASAVQVRAAAAETALVPVAVDDAATPGAGKSEKGGKAGLAQGLAIGKAEGRPGAAGGHDGPPGLRNRGN